MHDLIIYGAGGFGREIRLLIDQINAEKKSWNVVGFVDDNLLEGTEVDGVKVLGGMKYLNELKEPIALVIAIADPVIRMTVVQGLPKTQENFPTLIHPQANIGDIQRNTLGRGAIITAGCTLTTHVHIGNFAIVNLHCTVGHDTAIGDFCTLMPGCNISGNVGIGQATLVGSGAQVLQNLNIGSRCKVGAGAVVINHFGDNLTIVGVPGKARA
jgi:sugar O-acyltransferase (sialic acid O-acetyltransferase NeuD family)